MTELTRRSLSVDEYRAELRQLVTPDDRVEVIALDDALGRVLADEVAARTANPAFDNSAMDGYALRHADIVAAPVRLQVVGEVAAGSAADPALPPGTCVRIMTGAPLPSAADTIVRVEDTDGGVEAVEIRVAPPTGAHIRRAGEDYPAGAVVAPAGATVTPGILGAVAAAGLTSVGVRPHPVVVVAVTGDELVSDGSPLARGQLYESNSHVLAAALRRDGARVVRTAVPVRDQAEALVAWLDSYAPGADLVLLTGGASVGAYDVVRDVLTAAGGVFRHVRVQPGKPQGWARWNGTPVVALPGNPVSAALSYEVFVRPLLRRMVGSAATEPLLAVAAVGWNCPPGRQQLLPVTLASSTDGRLLARPVHARGSASHLVSSLAGADGIALIGEAADRVEAGDLVQVQRL